MDNQDKGGDRRRGDNVALRFGGSITGVGLAASILYGFGSDRPFTAPLSVVLLLVGLTLLAIGYGSRRRYRS